jgi:uncharacterized protein (TIGR02996 family)
MSRIIGSLSRLLAEFTAVPPEMAPSAEESAFLQAICAVPDDDTPRLIYADWLEERGDPRAEFIRLQCELASTKAGSARQKDLLIRERQLLRKHHRRWVACYRPLIGLIRSQQLLFHRGFVEEVLLNATVFAEKAQALLALGPLRRVHLREANGQMAAVAACAQIAELSELHFVGILERQDLHALAACPYLCRLDRLVVHTDGHAAEQSEVFVASPFRARETVIHAPFGERVLFFGSPPASTPVDYA